jgi:hypothetical protein
MVVSHRQHDGESTMHRRANDHLNVADVCVVWSDTAFSPYLRKIDFWNGIFTCNVETSDGAVGGPVRGTSTTRDDTGNGACETIYVDEFEIVVRASSGWRLAMQVSLGMLVLCLVLHFAMPYRAHG